MGTYILVAASAVWGLLHSWMASHGFKAWLTARLGPTAMQGYRLAYNIFSAMTILPVLALMALLPDQPFYSVSEPWPFLMLVGQLIGLAGALVSVFQTDVFEFAGLRPFMGGARSDGKLVTSGLYQYMRHPIYTFSLLFLWSSAAVSYNQFVVYLSLTIYMLVGAFFEERKLLRDFGAAYAEYRAKTPMFIPGLPF